MTSPHFHLYQFPLDAPSRRIRMVLTEKGLTYETSFEKPWELSEAFLNLNPAGELPVLVITERGQTQSLSDAEAISEYLDETTAAVSLLGKDPLTRAEIRRLVAWFDYKFYREVTEPIISEKVLKRLSGFGEPDSFRIRSACTNLKVHLDYVSWLCDQRNWLGGDRLSLADFAAAAHLSVLDYCGDVLWDDHPVAKEWYTRLKSRPCFRDLLADRITGFPPPPSYGNLDF